MQYGISVVLIAYITVVGVLHFYSMIGAAVLIIVPYGLLLCYTIVLLWQSRDWMNLIRGLDVRNVFGDKKRFRIPILTLCIITIKVVVYIYVLNTGGRGGEVWKFFQDEDYPFRFKVGAHLLNFPKERHMHLIGNVIGLAFAGIFLETFASRLLLALYYLLTIFVTDSLGLIGPGVGTSVLVYAFKGALLGHMLFLNSDVFYVFDQSQASTIRRSKAVRYTSLCICLGLTWFGMYGPLLRQDAAKISHSGHATGLLFDLYVSLILGGVTYYLVNRYSQTSFKPWIACIGRFMLPERVNIDRFPKLWHLMMALLGTVALIGTVLVGTLIVQDSLFKRFLLFIRPSHKR